MQHSTIEYKNQVKKTPKMKKCRFFAFRTPKHPLSPAKYAFIPYGKTSAKEIEQSLSN
jgi:hypothetical protein